MENDIEMSIGLREKDTGLLPSSLWNLEKDSFII
jgi:hypothetical protein